MRACRTVDLALQGGGAHGAFTWGVLDRLLQDERIEFTGISGASAGAMNAVVLADGLRRGGRKAAREQLRRFWHLVSQAGRTPWSAWFDPDLLRQTPLGWTMEWVGRSFSPYQLNPLDLNPLRDILLREIDFDALRADEAGPHLFISATHVRTGRLREFRRAELSADAIMASACLPMLFRAVEIDGEAYWDGGYVGNPSLLPLVAESDSHDLVLVQINPSMRAEVPTRAADIVDRLNEITFNSSLLKELRSLALLQSALAEPQTSAGPPPRLLQQVAELRTHRIAAEDDMARLGASSKTNTQWSFLTRLQRIGYRAASEWLERDFTHVGRRSSLDLRQFL